MQTNESSYLSVKVGYTLTKTYSTWPTEMTTARWPLLTFFMVYSSSYTNGMVNNTQQWLCQQEENLG